MDKNVAKNPAFQFYGKDWLADPALQAASSSSRGIWANTLCYMWESVTRGKISGTINELSMLLRASNGDFSLFLDEIQRLKFGDVTICNNLVTLINRRMFREQKQRENTRLRVAKFRSNISSNESVTVLSPSPSPNKEKKYNKEKNIFGEFQNVKLTEEEYKKLIDKFGQDGINDRIENLSQYVASKGKKYSSHYATILNWERKNNGTTKPKSRWD